MLAFHHRALVSHLILTRSDQALCPLERKYESETPNGIFQRELLWARKSDSRRNETCNMRTRATGSSRVAGLVRL